MVKTADIIKDFCEEYDLGFYNDYSGRGMYGKLCVGIVCGDILGTLVKLCDYLNNFLEDGESLSDYIGTPKTDSLGLDCILYFPNIQMS